MPPHRKATLGNVLPLRATCRLLALILLLSLGIPGARAQSKNARPRFRKLDAFVKQVMEAWDTPGLAIAAVKDGEVVLLQGYGQARRDGGREVTPQTLFNIASCTKAFTALAAAMLVDEGKLEWDKPVHDYRPDFELYDEYATLHATTRDLLCHRTGIGGHYGIQLLSQLSRQEILQRLRYLKPKAGFREKHIYSSLTYIAIGSLIEHVTGTSWEHFMEQRVFAPLGMHNSFPSRETLDSSVATAQPHDERYGELLDVIFHRNTVGAPAGGIYSNAEDMSKWLKLHLARGRAGRKRLVSTENMGQIHGPQIGLRYPVVAWPWNGDKYDHSSGLGWELGNYRGRPVVHCSGSNGGYTAVVRLLPMDNVGIVILTNHRLGYNVYDPVAYRIIDELLGLDRIDWHGRLMQLRDPRRAAGATAKARQGAGTPPSRPLAGYVGTYTHPAYGHYVITLDGEKLRGRFNHIDIGELEHVSSDGFRVKLRLVPPLDFKTHSDGSVSSISGEWVEGSDEPIVFKRLD